MILALAFTGFVPAAHLVSTQGWNEGLQGYAVTDTAVAVLLYFLAMFFYLTHIPERWWPHTFDLWVSGLTYFPIILCVKHGKLIRVC